MTGPCPEVSVVVPFVGDVAWLEEATRSVLEQTMSSLELIIVTDSPLDAVAHLATWDARVRILEGDKTGPAAARNIGVRDARAPYVAFLDADDVLLPQKLEHQLAAMAEAASSFSHTSYEQVTESGEPLSTIASGQFGGAVYPRVLLHCPVATPTVVVRRELLGERPFRESLRVADDTLLWIDLARRTQLLGLDEPLTKVRMHESNAALDPESQLIAWRSILAIALPQDRELPITTKRRTIATIHRTIAGLERTRGRRFAATIADLRATGLMALDPQQRRLSTRRVYASTQGRYARLKAAARRIVQRVSVRDE
jgi:glycosyltransferase involved in cell wall biosynthesis